MIDYHRFLHLARLRVHSELHEDLALEVNFMSQSERLKNFPHKDFLPELINKLLLICLDTFLGHMVQNLRIIRFLNKIGQEFVHHSLIVFILENLHKLVHFVSI